ncbi:TBC domain-containing protein kinase-like protein [Microplitis mediator]|uniref:TBC domain-containing protein kinase-like protein n=1 Tax=Microplitis mediator TaxID=375433 RepID=UPI002557491E|nr:TBC domain-containing protein kinase-like protein [Microplitis mediator]
MCPAILDNEERSLGGMTFFAQSHPTELCGSNGLPVTPNSITIYGKSQFLKTIRHQNLSSYLDIVRGKHERTIVVAEYTGAPLSGHITNENLTWATIKYIAYQCLSALTHIHDLGLTHRHLSPENILITKNHDIKLYNYGLYFMTDYGRNVSFPIGYPKYTAPEVFLHDQTVVSSPKVDSWSIGMIIAELLLKKSLWPNLKLAQCLWKLLSLLQSENGIFERLARECDSHDIYKSIPQDLRQFVEAALEVNPSKRLGAKELLNLPLFKDLRSGDAADDDEFIDVVTRKMDDYYYLWQLAGGDMTVELKKQGLIRSRPPILSIPNLIILLGQMFGRRDTAGLLDLRVVKVPLDTLKQRLYHVPYIANCPKLMTEADLKLQDELTSSTSKLPLIIRERDTEYQFYRLVLYERLLQGYPVTRTAILREAHKDIPPPVRGKVWAALLGVVGDIQKRYEKIDKETPTHTDRQIEVDIPRCHQYSELLSSGAGHERLQRLLKAWVRNNPQYVYWQGLDSLTAPFLYLNFNNEARAFACLEAFVPKYLHQFFLKDNSKVIQEYLGKFSQIIGFHDPKLANHLKGINFVPELFAIPWFLTMFSHVFPLHKILHLWDKLLLGDSSFPLMVGLAILKQLRDSLLTSGFNECILLFSDLPEIDIELCVKDSMDMYNNTPTSITYRKYQYDQSKANNWKEPENGTENMPRISIDDFMYYYDNKRDKLIVVDIRNNIQYERGAVKGSINIPFTSVQLSHTSIETLGSQAKILIDHENNNRVVVIIGPHDQNNALFAEFLIKCNIAGVCSLQDGIYALRSKCPNILVSIRDQIFV